MKNMRCSQKGFSIVEILIVILVIGLLGTAGWFVYAHQKSKTSEISNTQTDTTHRKEVTQKVVTIPSDWQWFMGKDSTTKFAYPRSWGNLVEKTEATQDAYDTNSFIGRVTISSKKDFLTQVPQGFVDYTWYKWDEDIDALVSAVDVNPPSDYNSFYVKPVTLGTTQDVDPIFQESKGRAMYEVQGKGANSCGVFHYFFSVKDKVVHIPATLCTKDSEWEPIEGQAYKEEITVPIQDFYRYIEQ